MSNQTKNYDEIWQLYAEKRMPKLIELSGKNIDIQTTAICPICGKEMLKKKPVGSNAAKMDKKHSWDVYVIDQNLSADDVTNLQPMHPDCLVLVQQVPAVSLMLKRLEGMANPWQSKTAAPKPAAKPKSPSTQKATTPAKPKSTKK